MESQIYQSVLGKKYSKSFFEERTALTIYQKFSANSPFKKTTNLPISKPLANILAAKFNKSSKADFNVDEIEDFLNPTIKSSLPDPFALLDMKEAVAKIISVIKTKQNITVFGDYDVDGATSSALLKRFFQAINVQINIYIPDRILEGYGPNAQALINLRKQGTDLVITVDCGTVAFEPLQAAKDVGLEVIVIDHHLGSFEKPEAIAVINPNRLDEEFPHKNLAAVGVCFLLVVAVNKALREENYYQKNNITEPNLLNLLDLVALGTVCDVMTLQGVNRAFVSQGLKIIKNRSNLGIRALCDLANLNEEPTSYHLGFVIGPRINAGGRVGRADLGARLLASNDEQETQKIAAELNIYNNQRKDIEQNILTEATAILEKTEQNNSVLLVSSVNWHQGVVGIVASRIKDLYEKPTAIIALKDGVGKASCRSINGVDLGAAIVKAKLLGILIEGGGHKMAAGFTILESKIEQLQNFLNAELGQAVELASQNKIKEFTDILDINSANLNLAKEISALEPFGVGNPKPRFLIKNLQIISANLVGNGEKHLRCVFAAKTLAGWQGKLVAFVFNAMDSALGEVLISKNKSQPLAVIAQINLNNWLGNQNIQLLIEDLVI